MKLIDRSVSDYIKKAEDKTSMPGGGSVAALSGALAASLAVMVLKLSGDEDPEGFDGPSSTLLENIDADSRSFDEVLQAFKLPKNSEAERALRSEAIQRGYRRAIDVPLETMAASVEVLERIESRLPEMTETAFSDILIASDLAKTAFCGAKHTVLLNLKALKDEALRREYEEEIERLERVMERAYEAIQEF